MANFTYNASIATDAETGLREFDTFEKWLDDISALEAAKIGAIVELPLGEVPTQGAYDALMAATANYYKKVK
jgi:hypothetical protein